MRLRNSVLSIFCVLSFCIGGLGAQDEWHTFRMPRLNQVHRDVVREVLPIRQGPILVRVDFLDHSVELKDHRLELARDSLSNSYSFSVVVTVEGEAEVESTLELAGLPASLRDQMRLPIQSISVFGRAEIGRDPEGYRISPEELPRFVQVEIESQLAQNMVTLCKGLAFLPGVGSACEGLKQSLAFIRIPLPEPGDTYLVPLELLTDSEVQEFDRYLTATNPSASPHLGPIQARSSSPQSFFSPLPEARP